MTETTSNLGDTYDYLFKFLVSSSQQRTSFPVNTALVEASFDCCEWQQGFFLESTSYLVKYLINSGQQRTSFHVNIVLVEPSFDFCELLQLI